MPQRSSKTGRRRRPTGRANDNSSRTKRRRAAATPPSRNFTPLAWLATVGLIAAGIFFAMRHNRATGPDSANSNATADGLLREMQAAYKNLNAYSDTSLIQLRDRIDDRWFEEASVIRTHYLRPNLLRMSVERPGTQVVIDLSSDGDQLRARVQDPGTGNFDNQLVQRAAPASVSIGTIYAATDYAEVGRPGELNSLLRLPAPLHISQLSALLDEQPFGGLLKAATAKTRLEDKQLNDTNCHRVAVVVEDGQFVFWIDPVTKLLQRIEYPPPGGEDSGGMLICDYSSIRTEPALRDVFQMPVPDNAKVVRNFVLPASSFAPKGLNELAGSLAFTNLAGETVTSDTFRDKISVLCWFDQRAANQVALEKLQAVYEATKQDDAYQFLMVSTDPTTVASHADVENLLNNWKITIPVVRDLAAVGRDRFDVQSTPTLIVIDDKGIVQLNETGVDPQLDQQLPGVLKLIADGKSIAADYIKFLQERKAAYEQQLAAASVHAPETPATHLPTEISPATQPQQLKLTRLWAQPDFTAAGNAYATVEIDDRVRVMVHDGWNELVELDATDGSILRRHTIADNQTAAIQRLRSFKDRTGKQHHLGWSTLTRQVAILDDTWKTIGVYPPLASANTAAIQAADLGDLNGDGQAELYVSFASSTAAGESDYVGLHAVSLDGQSIWKNEDVETVRSIVQSVDKTGQRFLLTTNSIGQIVPVAADGTSQRPINVGARAIHQLFASAPNDPDGVFCGFTFLPNGEKLAIGVGGDMKDKWSFTLPAGSFRNQIEFATTADWFENSPWWTIAGPDGSVSFVSHNSDFHDHFQSGQELAGIATYKTRGANVLLLSSAEGVSAWQVERSE